MFMTISLTPSVRSWPKALGLVIHLNDSNVPKVASNCSTTNGCYGALD
jgi:hypothetical protein